MTACIRNNRPKDALPDGAFTAPAPIMTSTQNTVHAEYTARLAQHSAARDALAQQDSRLSDIRLYIVIAAGLGAWLAWGRHWFSPWLLVLFPLAFVALAIRHERVAARRALARRRTAFYELGLARLEGRWMGQGVSGERFLTPEHPYAADLDIFGSGSLFELLCTARTRLGEDCLASWLLAPALPAAVRARQAAVRELAPRLNAREALALRGEEVRGKLQPETLARWGDAPVLLNEPWRRGTAPILAALSVAALTLWVLGHGWVPIAVMAAVVIAFEWPVRRRAGQVQRGLDGSLRDLGLLSSLLADLEGGTFTAPRLVALQASLSAGGERPSARIGRLQTIAGLLEVPKNPLLALPAAALLWTTQCALAAEAWRARNGPALRRWVEAVGEYEALTALAGYAYEHPEDAFPEIADGSGACFAAVGLSHPLLPPEAAVRNDVSLGGAAPGLLLVSGSNMSGKSTLLRAIGVAAVLAGAGAPVRARRLRLSPLSVGASLRTQDSLGGGISRFYAEILRLRQIVEIGDTDGPPLLFLIDEILHGTNSHDRRLGTEAIARALVRQGSVGLITTHDLALAALTEDPALAAANVHFEDQMTEGRMSFDYHLRPGLVTGSNAIALMRAVGLDV